MKTDGRRAELEGIVRRYCGFWRGRSISNQTRIYFDLGIYGDDAWELLEEIHNRFGTRFEGFDGPTYFPEEMGTAGKWIAWLFGKPEPWKPVTFGHLFKVVEAGRWFDPPDDAMGSGLRPWWAKRRR